MDDTRKPGGRPKIAADARLSKQLDIRLNTEDWELAHAVAASLHLPIRLWARNVVMAEARRAIGRDTVDAP